MTATHLLPRLKTARKRRNRQNEPCISYAMQTILESRISSEKPLSTSPKR